MAVTKELRHSQTASNCTILQFQKNTGRALHKDPSFALSI